MRLSHDGSASAISGSAAGRGRPLAGLSLWVPSQNGARRDLPHRHGAMICPFLGTTAPAGPMIWTGPRTSYGPSGQMVIRVAPEGSGISVIIGSRPRSRAADRYLAPAHCPRPTSRRSGEWQLRCVRPLRVGWRRYGAVHLGTGATPETGTDGDPDRHGSFQHPQCRPSRAAGLERGPSAVPAATDFGEQDRDTRQGGDNRGRRMVAMSSTGSQDASNSNPRHAGQTTRRRTRQPRSPPPNPGWNRR